MESKAVALIRLNKSTKFRFFFQKVVDFHKVRFKISSVNIFLYEAALP